MFQISLCFTEEGKLYKFVFSFVPNCMQQCFEFISVIVLDIERFGCVCGFRRVSAVLSAAAADDSCHSDRCLTLCLQKTEKSRRRE